MKKILTFVLCLVLVAGLSIAGTIAWLTDTTTEITNTFTTSGIDITLIETKNPDGTEVAAGVTDWSAQLIPGKSYDKNPVVSVVRPETDVDVYLFVKMEDTASEYLEFTNNLTSATKTDADGNSVSVWTKLKDVDANTSIWYQIVEADQTETSWHLIGKDKVTVKDLTKDSVAQKNVAIKYTAYAIQTEGFDSAADAWEKIGN